MEFFSKKYDEIYILITGRKPTAKPGNLVEEQSFPGDNLSRRLNKLVAEVQDHSNRIAMFKETLNDQEHYTRRDCLEIRGLPATSTENTNDLVKSVGKLIGVEIKDISTSHQLKASRNDANNKNDPAIIVKFTGRDVKDKMYSARKTYVTNQQETWAFLGTMNPRFFLAESLTQTNKYLFNETLKVKKELHFKFMWTSNGRIHLRKDTTHPVIDITSAKGLQTFREKHAKRPTGSRPK